MAHETAEAFLICSGASHSIETAVTREKWGSSQFSAVEAIWASIGRQHLQTRYAPDGISIIHDFKAPGHDVKPESTETSLAFDRNGLIQHARRSHLLTQAHELPAAPNPGEMRKLLAVPAARRRCRYRGRHANRLI